jgi:hypothetical protein
MSQYVSVGVTDETLAFKAGEPGSSGADPVSLMNSLFDFISKTGLDLQNALESPKVREFMQQAGIKAQEVQVEAKRREQKSNLLLWGGIAAGVAFLALRKKR